METLGNTLRNGRKTMGLTLRQVEESTKISNAYLSQLENDKIKSPSANILYKLSSLYKIPLNELLANAGIIEPKPKLESESSDHEDFISDIASSSEGMSTEERKEVLDYLKYIKSKNKSS
ncbi:helix-turn-helix domain-containing protein [Labilibaculum euxinus]